MSVSLLYRLPRSVALVALTDEVSPVFRALDREVSADDLVRYLVLVADNPIIRLSCS